MLLISVRDGRRGNKLQELVEVHTDSSRIYIVRLNDVNIVGTLATYHLSTGGMLGKGAHVQNDQRGF